MKILLQLSILFTICLLGNFISSLLPISFPGSVFSMILLFLLLLSKWLKIEQIEESSNFLLQNMAFFYIPAGVGLINYFDILIANFIPLIIIGIVTTILTFIVTGYTVTIIIKLQNKKK